MTFDSTYTKSDNNNDNSLRTKVVVAGVIALLLGVASHSSNGGDTAMLPFQSVLRSKQETEFGVCTELNKFGKAEFAGVDLASMDPLTLEQDLVFTKKNTKLDMDGCMGDITVTVAKGASISGFGDGQLDFEEISCRFNLVKTILTGQWKLMASDPSSTVKFEAMVSTSSTNCDKDQSESVTIKVMSPTVAVNVGLNANVQVTTTSAIVEKLSLDEVVITFEQAEIDSGNYDSEEAVIVTNFINTDVLPKLNTFVADRLPTTIAVSDISSKEAFHKFLEAFLKKN